MDGATLTGYIVAIGTLGLLWVAVRQGRKDDAVKEKIVMNERLKPIEDELARQNRHHALHFTASGTNSAAIASLGQQVNDHEKQDGERFDRIEQMHTEIRGDIKELLKRSASAT